jgi:hypothetical protein
MMKHLSVVMMKHLNVVMMKHLNVVMMKHLGVRAEGLEDLQRKCKLNMCWISA